MTDELDILIYIAEQIHNEKVRRNIKKFHETGKFIDDEEKGIKIGETVNYRLVK